MMEYITVLAGIVYFLAALYGYSIEQNIKQIFYIISSLAFLIIALALATVGLDALSLPVTIYLGTIYPTFLALAILYKLENDEYWKYFLYYVIFALILIAIGKSVYTPLATVIQIITHSIAGLIIVFLPLIKTLVSKEWDIKYLTFTIGGIVIGIGGLALATIAANAPMLPFDLVVQLLHPLLFISAFLIAIGVFITVEKQA